MQKKQKSASLSKPINYSVLSDRSNQQKSKIKKYVSFKPIKYLKLYDIYQQIIKIQQKQHKQSMFPSHFAKQHESDLSTYLFEIQVEDEYKKWIIIKRLSQLVQLQQHLRNKYPQATQIFPIPFREEKKITRVYASSILELFGTFLNCIANIEFVRKQKKFKLFIENCVSDDKKKIKTFFQVRINKKAGGRHTQSNLTRIIYNFVSWRHKFFTITKEGIFYTDNQDSFEIRQMILFNQTFSVLHGEVKTGYTYGVMLNSSHRLLQVDTQNIYNFLLFIYFLRKAMNQYEVTKINRFNSFSKVQQKNCEGSFFIDGENYFKEVFHEIKKAKQSIFITGWFLTPYMYLIQKYESQEFRLDKILLQAAETGIKVYIVIYNAPKIALYIDPEFTQNYLRSLHSNIKVLRHPNYMVIPFMWSHHQKLVVIDQKVGFMGGLDIAYGRLDNNQHKLGDEQQRFWKGVQYCNFRIIDLIQPHNYQKCSIDRMKQPRMPWHDVGVKIKGPSVLDLSRHFTQYWNYVNFQLNLSQRQLILFTGIHQQQLQMEFEDIEIQQFRQIDANIQQTFEPKLQKVKQELTQDQVINLLQLKTKNQSKIASFSAIQSQRLYDEPTLNRLQSSQFLVSNQNCYKTQETNYYLSYLKENNNRLLEQNKKTSSQSNLKFIDLKEKKQLQQNMEDLIVTETILSNQTQDGLSSNQPTQIKQTHQILRSASLWSLGLQEGKEERSILQAYCSLIENAKHFIYIENQFFISVQNPISQLIAQKIDNAFRNKQKFRVVIVIPFLPGFDGDVQNQAASLIRIQIDLIYKTICRGENSLYKKLQHIPNLHDYLGIYCLRNHGKIKGTPVTQIVYVHSKVLLVDDQIALIGSANINDRSLMGTRDSQLALVIEDGQQTQIQNFMPKIPKLKVKKFPHQLRKALYVEHFGMTSAEAENFFDDKIWEIMQFNAQRNQKIYRKIFGCYPDNFIKNFQDIQKLKQQTQIERYQELIPLIKGYACPFQNEFLCNQNLELKSHQKQYYVPFINFT